MPFHDRYVCCAERSATSDHAGGNELRSPSVQGLPGSGRKRRRLRSDHDHGRGLTWSVTDEWCRLVAPNGTRVKYGDQCATAFYTVNADGSYTCETWGEKKGVGVVFWVVFCVVCCCLEICSNGAAEHASSKEQADRIRAARPSHLVRSASSSVMRAVSSADGFGGASWGVVRVQPADGAAGQPRVEEGVEVVPAGTGTAGTGMAEAAALPVGVPVTPLIVAEPLPDTRIVLGDGHTQIML